MATLQNVIDSARYDLRDVGAQDWDDTQIVDYMNRMFVVMDDILIRLNSDLTRTSTTVTLTASGNTATMPTRCDFVTKIWDAETPIEKRSLDEVMYRYHLNNHTRLTGTADSLVADKLSDSTATFETDNVAIGWYVFNVTDGTSTTVSAVDSETALSLNDDIFDTGNESYVVANNVGEPVYWAFNAGNFFFDRIADVDYTLTVYYHVKTATLASTDNMPHNDLFNEYFREALISMAQKAKKDNVVNVDRQFYRYFEDIAKRVVISRNHNPKDYHIDF